MRTGIKKLFNPLSFRIRHRQKRNSKLAVGRSRAAADRDFSTAHPALLSQSLPRRL